MPTPIKIRLQKALAQAGIASRRKAEELIAAGKVEVNGAIVTEQGVQVEPDRDLIRVNGRLLEREKKVYFVLYKPPEVVTTLSDPQGRTTVAEFLKDVRQRVFAVGRLDYDAEGALIVTNDGDLANKLMHPKFQVPRVYMAKVKGVPDAATMEQAKKGVRLEDGFVTPLEVEAGTTAEKNTWIKLVLTEGRPHLVKRFFAAIGHPVVRLYRPLYGGVSARGMRPGQLRPLEPEEVNLLKCGGRAPIPSIADIKAPPRRHRDADDQKDGNSNLSDKANQGRTYTNDMEDDLIYGGKKKSTGRNREFEERFEGLNNNGDFKRGTTKSRRTHNKNDGRFGGNRRGRGNGDDFDAPRSKGKEDGRRWNVTKSHAQTHLDAVIAKKSERKFTDVPPKTTRHSAGGEQSFATEKSFSFGKKIRGDARKTKPFFSKSGKFDRHGKTDNGRQGGASSFNSTNSTSEADFQKRNLKKFDRSSDERRSNGKFSKAAGNKISASDRFDHRVTGIRHGLRPKGRR